MEQTWNIKKMLDWAIEYFRSKEVPQPRLSAELLLSDVVGLSRMELYLNYARVLQQSELQTYKKYIIKRLEHVPIQYILGQAYFRKIKLYVDGNVLIPRPETELLVDKAMEIIKELAGQKQDPGSINQAGNGTLGILEIGTGSGAIALSLAFELKETMEKRSFFITATENNAAALSVARKNASGILGRDAPGLLDFIECDLIPGNDTGCKSRFARGTDLVISNPPYILDEDYDGLPREVRDYEPKSSLVAGKTGLEVYERIFSGIKPCLNPNLSFIILETDPRISASLEEMASGVFPSQEIWLEKDYNQRDRILVIKIRSLS